MYARILITAILLLRAVADSFSQLQVTPNNNPSQLAQTLAGAGVAVSNATMNCPGNTSPVSNPSGTFNGTASNIGITSGVLLTTGDISQAVGPNSSSAITTSNISNMFNDPNLMAIEPNAINDVCILEFDVVPMCSTLVFTFAFGSDEYPEFVNSQYNDAFGIFVTGPNPTGPAYSGYNMALIPTAPVSINTVNNGVICPTTGPCMNCAYYVDNCNTGPPSTIEYDGFTLPVTVTIDVSPCANYHLKLAIADAGDHAFDSGVFFEAASLTTCSTIPITVNATSTPAACGANNGTATATAGGGSSPYTYVWAPVSQTAQTATGLPAGTYTVTVFDNNGCSSVSDTITVTSTSPPILAFPAVVNVACFGGNTGSATMNASNGTNPFTYVWNTTPVQSTQTATGLTAGTYTGVAVDANGCIVSGTVTITQPPALTNTVISATNVSCFGGNNGAAAASAGGGTPGYSYVWSNGQSSSSTTGLSIGNYTVTAIDANGCTQTSTVSITQPTPLTNSISNVINVDCFGNNIGSAMATGAGGTPQYTYSWNTIPPQTAQTVTGLFAGVYSVTVTDSAGCSHVDTVQISTPTTLSLFSPNIINVDCFGNSTGVATVNPTGGSPGYTFSWNPTGQTTGNATGLAVGVYTVTITDNNGCIIKTLIPVTEPPLLTSTTSQANILCFGGSTGTATVTPAGGTPGYTYIWNNSQTNAVATNLTSGSYSVLITDANGCTATNTFILTQPASPVTGTVSATPLLCNGDSTGAASVIVSGGTPGYSYSWSTGATTTGISNLGAGTYTITFTDGNSCVGSLTVSVTEPPVLTATISPDSTICLGTSITEIISASGGTQGYTYSWMPGGETTSSVFITPAGTTTYSAQVTDANGCTTPVLATTVTTIQLDLAHISVSPDVVVFYPATICFTADTAGVTSWNWNLGDSATATGSIICHDYPKTGSYCVLLTVANGQGCLDTAEVCVFEVEAVIPNVFSPNGDGVNDLFVLDVVTEGLTSFECKIYDRWGIQMAVLDKPREGWDGHTTAGALASPGTYYYTVNITWGNLAVQKRGFLTLLK